MQPSQIASRVVQVSPALFPCLLIALFLGVPMWVGAEPAAEDSVGNEGAPAKAAVCASNSSSTWCSGLYSEIVKYIRVDANSKSYIRAQPPLITEAQASGTCTIANWVKVWPDGDGGEESQLNVLYMSWMTNAKIVISIAAYSDGSCYLKNISALYP